MDGLSLLLFRRVWVINAEVCRGRLHAVCSWPRSPLLNYTCSGSSGDHGPPLPSDHHLITPTRRPKRGHWPSAVRDRQHRRDFLWTCVSVFVSALVHATHNFKNTLSSYLIYKEIAFKQWFWEGTECEGLSYKLVKWKALDAKKKKILPSHASNSCKIVELC